MKQSINCFIPFEGVNQIKETVATLQASDFVNDIYLLIANNCRETIAGCQFINIDSLKSTATLKKIAAKASTAYTLIYTKSVDLQLGYFALEHMLQIAKMNAHTYKDRIRTWELEARIALNKEKA